MTGQNPTVSIVINNYNYARYLRRAIDSALAQDYPHLEVVVVDDGSTDDSRAVIGGYGARIHAILQENRGQIGAINAGVAASRGDIVFLLDADDALLPDAASTVVSQWRPGISKVQFRLSLVDADGRPLGSAFPNYPENLTPAKVRRELVQTGLYPTPPTSGNAYARTFLSEIVPLPQTFAAADGPINTAAPICGDVVTVNRTLGAYRVHGRNAWALSELDPDRFSHFIRHDQRRIAYLREIAAARGTALAPDVLDRGVVHLQYRLVSLRLRPERHPVHGDTPGRILRLAVRAVLTAEGRLASRLVLLGWFAALAVAPRRGAEILATWRFVPARRPALMTGLMRRLGALSHVGRVDGASQSP